MGEYVRIEHGFLTHKKWEDVPIRTRDTARCLLLGLILESHEQATDGRVSREMLARVSARLGVSRGTLNRATQYLVNARFLDVEGGGKSTLRSTLIVHDYTDYQESADAIESRRRATRDRVRKLRESRAVTPYVQRYKKDDVTRYKQDDVTHAVTQPRSRSTASKEEAFALSVENAGSTPSGPAPSNPPGTENGKPPRAQLELEKQLVAWIRNVGSELPLFSSVEGEIGDRSKRAGVELTSQQHQMMFELWDSLQDQATTTKVKEVET